MNKKTLLKVLALVLTAAVVFTVVLLTVAIPADLARLPFDRKHMIFVRKITTS